MANQLGQAFLDASIKRLGEYKQMADLAINQLDESQLFKTLAIGSNSILIIMQHMAGNMLSRWTNFLSEDGEKPWRDRDQEFEPVFKDKASIAAYWEKGWGCLLDTLSSLYPTDLEKQIQIRGEGLKVQDAIIRQLMHYSSHVGQIIYLSKMLKGADWQPLTIDKNKSKDYNLSLGYEQ